MNSIQTNGRSAGRKAKRRVVLLGNGRRAYAVPESLLCPNVKLQVCFSAEHFIYSKWLVNNRVEPRIRYPIYLLLHDGASHGDNRVAGSFSGLPSRIKRSELRHLFIHQG